MILSLSLKKENTHSRQVYTQQLSKFVLVNEQFFFYRFNLMKLLTLLILETCGTQVYDSISNLAQLSAVAPSLTRLVNFKSIQTIAIVFLLQLWLVLSLFFPTWECKFPGQRCLHSHTHTQIKKKTQREGGKERGLNETNLVELSILSICIYMS